MTCSIKYGSFFSLSNINTCSLKIHNQSLLREIHSLLVCPNQYIEADVGSGKNKYKCKDMPAGKNTSHKQVKNENNSLNYKRGKCGKIKAQLGSLQNLVGKHFNGY